MSEKFLEELKRSTSMTETTNGATAYSTTFSSLLDFFAEGGAMRDASPERIISSFEKALQEDTLLAMKCLFYFRDIRGGQGERRLFRLIIKHLAHKRPQLILKNLHNIYEYGRYDDLITLIDTPLKEDVVKIIKQQLIIDYNSKNPSLLAKWMPSENTSSYKTRKLAKNLRDALKMSSKKYQKILSTLRERIRVTESIISRSRWEELELSKLTANNYLKYANAFNNRIPEKWNNYLDDVSQNKKEIKSSTLYPYDIVHKVRMNLESDWNSSDNVYDELWKALPNYSDDKRINSLCVVDTSGSMYTQIGKSSIEALDVAISLGLYISERVNSVFKNNFLTFSKNPKLQTVIGSTLTQKIMNMESANWGMNTDLEKTFRLILDIAIKNNLSQEDIPEKLIVISDMQFDEAIMYNTNKKTLFENISYEFEKHGYSMPLVVFWNVLASKTAFQVDKDTKNVLLCSGCSPSILKGVLKYSNPMELMLETLNDKRYSNILI